MLSSQGRAEWTRYPADIPPLPPAWGTPAWRGWAHCGALWCFPHWRWLTRPDLHKEVTLLHWHFEKAAKVEVKDLGSESQLKKEQTSIELSKRTLDVYLVEEPKQLPACDTPNFK